MRRLALAIATLALAVPAAAKAPEAIALPADWRNPESVSIAPDGMAYLGSLYGGILRVSLKSGRADVLVKPGAGGSASIFGLLADPAHGLLWVCSNDIREGWRITVAGAAPGTTLRAFDLRTGAPRRSVAFPEVGAFCNDMAVAKDGTLYVTETGKSHIFRLKPGSDTLEDWHHDPAYASAKGSGLDGIAIGGDGHLYVNNFESNVLARVAVKADGTAGNMTVLTLSRPLDMPDGLRALGGLRFAQAESRGQKVAIVTVSGDKATVQTVGEGVGEATGVDAYGGALWYNQAMFDYVFDPGKKAKGPPPGKLTPVLIPAGDAHASHP